MSDWLDKQKKSSGNFRQLLQKQIEKANPRRELNAEEAKRLEKLEAISDKLKRGENVQNRVPWTRLIAEEYAAIDTVLKQQKEITADKKTSL